MKTYFDTAAPAAALITGGSARERTKALKFLAEQYSLAGIPVFAADISGDLSALAAGSSGSLSGREENPAGGQNAPADGAPFPCTFWDLAGETGLPLRTTVSELGPLLLSRLLSLSEAQRDLLQICFRIADEQGLLLIDTKDLRALIREITENRAAYEKQYGAIQAAQLSALLKALTLLEQKGGRDFLFEPAIDVRDFMVPGDGVRGRIHILDALETAGDEAVYSAILLYLLSECGTTLPVSDEGVSLVFLIDEAQLLFAASPCLSMARIRRMLSGLCAKGIAVVFASGAAGDIPEEIRARLDCGDVSEFADAVCLSGSRPLPAGKRLRLIAADPLRDKYLLPFDRDSACEFLQRRGLSDRAQSGVSPAGGGKASAEEPVSEDRESTSAKEGASKKASSDMARRAQSSAQSLGNTVAGTIGRQIGKSVGSNFGSFGSTLGGNVGASLGRGIMKTFFSK